MFHIELKKFVWLEAENKIYFISHFAIVYLWNNLCLLLELRWFIFNVISDMIRYKSIILLFIFWLS